MASQVQNPLISPGSLVLVTAANGLIASHIVDQLLTYGYAVRGTVRSLERSAWLEPLLLSRHPDANIEIVEIPDISQPGCYDQALKGVSSVIHTAANTSLPDDLSSIDEAIKTTLNVFEAAAKANQNGEKILKVTLTSSSWAIRQPTPNVRLELFSNTYNLDAEKILNHPDTPKEARPLLIYTLSKVKSEQAAWKWIEEHADSGLIFNSVLPATTIGPVLAPKEQEYPSTAGFVRSLYENDRAYLFDWLEPQWYVDPRDVGRLHVAAAVLAGVENERVFGWAEPYTWVGVKAALEKEMGTEVAVKLSDKGEDLHNIDGPRKISTELLKRLGRESWEKFEESVGLNIRSFYPK